MDATPLVAGMMAQQIDAGVKAILDEAFARALGTLTANRKLLESTAADLLERETLSAEDLEPVRQQLTQPGGGKRPRKAAG